VCRLLVWSVACLGLGFLRPCENGSSTAAKRSGSRCPVRLGNSQDVSLIQRVLMTLVLRLIMNGGFSFDSADRVFRVLPGFMGKLLVIAVRS